MNRWRRMAIEASQSCLPSVIQWHADSADRQPALQVTPTRLTLLFRQITWHDQNEWPLSKVRSNLSGMSSGATESKLIQAPSEFRLSTVHPRRRALHNDFGGLTHLGSGRTWPINQHVGTPQIRPNMQSNLYKLDKMIPVLWQQRFRLSKPTRWWRKWPDPRRFPDDTRWG